MFTFYTPGVMVNTDSQLVLQKLIQNSVYREMSMIEMSMIDSFVKLDNSFYRLFNFGPSIKYVRKIFRKTNISNPLIRVSGG